MYNHPKPVIKVWILDSFEYTSIWSCLYWG